MNTLREQTLQDSINVAYLEKALIYDDHMKDNLLVVSNEDLVEKMNFNPDDKVLDAGTGTGNNLIHMPDYCDIHAIDINDEMLKIAKIKALNSSLQVSFDIQDLRAISYDDNFFDKSMISYILSACSNPKRVLEEVIRVTKPQGTVGILDFKISLRFPSCGVNDLNLRRVVSSQKDKVIIQEKIHYRRANINDSPQSIYLLKVL